MKKIRVVHHSQQLGLGGTEKELELLCKHLNKEEFEVHALAPRFPVPIHRKAWDAVRRVFGSKKAASRLEQHRLDLVRVPELIKILGEKNVHLYHKFSLPKILNQICPDILHLHHSGILLPPWNRLETLRNIPIVFTVNVFGYQDRSESEKKINRILFPSNWLKETAAVWSKGDPRCGVLYCPIEKPASQDDFREELKIPKEAFVVGRIGRNADDIHDPISIQAYHKIENESSYFLIVSPPPLMKKEIEQLKLKNVLTLEASIDPIFLSRFYNTIDVLAHARADGETFGCVIAEAMIHGKPVVTHRSPIRNAQSELVTPECGFVVGQNDDRSYAECLKRLREDMNLKAQMGLAAEKRALAHFEAERITRQLEQMYKEEIRKLR